MLADFLLLADLFDVVKAAIPLLFLVIWVLSQVMGGGKDDKKPAQRQARRIEPPPGEKEKEKEKDKDLRKEIEVFLKQAEQQRSDRPRQDPPRRERRPPPRRPVETAVEAEVVEPIEAASQRLAPAMEAFKPSQLGKLSSQVGGRIEPTIEQRLHEKFDHAVGHIGTPLTAPAAHDLGERRPSRLPSIAAEIARVFDDPLDVRKAIVLAEVLRRPEERW